MKNSKTLVVYFSASGVTERAAKTIAEVTGADLFEIVPQKAYSSADLDWTDKRSRSSVEMRDPSSRPAIKSVKADIADYDLVFIGYPIWWNLAPTIVNTFIESHDLSGSVLVPFVTSGGSSITNSVSALRRTYPQLNWRDGRLLNRASAATVSTWVSTL